MRLRKNKNMPADNTPSFIQTQHEFTQYIRDPKKSPRPTDIEERRINIYRDLLFTNISTVLSDGFPVLKKISSEQDWEAMCRDFYSQHSSHSPYFSDIPQEFIQYLQNERLNNPEARNDFPFLLELAHYEWVELVVSIAEDEKQTAPITAPLTQVLTVSSTALALAYSYPVHTISPENLPTEAAKQPTYLVVYRDTDNRAAFLDITPITHALLVALADNTEQTTDLILSKLADELQHPDPSIIIDGGLTILNDFISRGIVISAS